MSNQQVENICASIKAVLDRGVVDEILVAHGLLTRAIELLSAIIAASHEDQWGAGDSVVVAALEDDAARQLRRQTDDLSEQASALSSVLNVVRAGLTAAVQDVNMSVKAFAERNDRSFEAAAGQLLQRQEQVLKDHAAAIAVRLDDTDGGTALQRWELTKLLEKGDDNSTGNGEAGK